jgi:endonuclease/exonuclease/phosphatase family metal-dependent hydrolase
MAMILIGLVAPLLGCQISEPLTVRVMTYNILVGGTRLGQPLEQTAAVIEAAEADIIGLQEQAHHADDLAAMLGFDHRVHGNSPAILSRWPIVDASPRGVVVALPNGRRVHVYNVHLTAYPYQPYDLRDQKIHTPAEAVAAARATRGAAVTALLEEIQPALDEAQPVFVTGDFNEPSHLDWIPATADAHLGYAVRWPTSRALTGVGLRDAYRAVHPDPASRPAPTWTPLRTAPANEVHDRIDWVLYAGQGVRVIDARVVGERAASADIVVQPFPSDHRAVVATFLVD